LLWNLGLDVTLAELTCLPQKCFRTMDEEEQFRRSCQLTRRPKAGEELQGLHNGICRLTIGIIGPSLDLINVVGCDPFLKPLGDQHSVSGSWRRC